MSQQDTIRRQKRRRIVASA